MDMLDDQLEFESPPEEGQADAPHWRREHFIPLRRAELVRALADTEDVPRAERRHVLRVCRLLTLLLQHEFRQRLEILKSCYAPFNPDSVVLELTEPIGEAREQRSSRFFDAFDELLVRANYQQLSHADIQKVVGTASQWGVRLRADFSIFRQLRVYARGDVIAQRTLRNWRTFYRAISVDLPVYQRLVVVFRLKQGKVLGEQQDDHAIYLKIFKNIPKQDVDMLLPGSRFRMSLLDHGKAVLPTVSGLAIAANKLMKGAVILSLASLGGKIAFVGFVGGLIGYGVKSVLGYLHTKSKYQLNLTQRLYFQSLDSNAGVLFRLLDEGEEQDVREAILGYEMLRRHAGPDGLTAEQLDDAAEQFLHKLLGIDVDFEVDDGLEKLARFGCAQRGEDGRWRALPLNEAIEHLEQLAADVVLHGHRQHLADPTAQDADRELDGATQSG